MPHATVFGRQLEYRIIPGEAALPWLVLLHEGLGSVSLWRSFPDLVARRLGAPVLVYSRQGYGQSDALNEPRRPDFMHDEAIRVLPALLDGLGITRSILIGHSDGASIALIHAAMFPARVAATVLMAPHVKVEPISTESIARIRAVYEATDLRERLSRHHAHVDDAFRGWSDIWLDPDFARWSLEAECQLLQAPTLLIQGVNDEYGTLDQLDTISRLSPAPIERLVLERCGHAPQRDQTEAVLDAIARFAERPLRQ